MLLRTENLSKLYGSHKALDSLCMTVGEGSIKGFIGPNGAGKTTAMRMIVTLMRPSAGEVFVNETPVSKDVRAARNYIGYVPDFFGVYATMTPMEYLNFYADINGVPVHGRENLMEGLLSLVKLQDKTGSDVNKLSRGMKQRLCLARALLHNPKLLVLDEPASGLDPQSRADLKTILLGLKQDGKGILISSHILPELAEFCDSVAILNKGVKLAEGSIDEIGEMLGEKESVSLTLVDEAQIEDAVSILKMNGQIGEIIRDGMVLEAEFKGNDMDLAAIIKRLALSDILLTSVTRTQHSLEKIFLEVIGNEKQS